HFGVACHVSSHVGGPVRPAAPRVVLMLTVHVPCSRPAARGGVAVVTTMTGDGAERLPPRSAATRYRYAVAGASPVPREEGVVPGAGAAPWAVRRGPSPPG